MKIFVAWSAIWLGARLAAGAAPAVNPLSFTNAVQVTPAYINELVESLRTNHLLLRAAAERTNAAQHNAQAVRTWDDPIFKLGGVTTSSRGSKLSEDGDLVYGLEQKLPLFGKASAARRVAESQTATASAYVAYQFQTLRRDFSKAIFAAAQGNSVVEAGKEDLVWLQTMVKVVEERFRTGQSTLFEVLKLQAERDKRMHQSRTDGLKYTDARVVLNRMLNRDLHAFWPRLELPPVAPAVEYSTRLADLAVKYEPRLGLMRREIQQARDVVDLTRRSRLPDVSVGIEGRQYSGDGGFREGMLTLSMTLPWGNAGRYRSDLGREQARLLAVEFAAADQELAVREVVHHLTVMIDAARREAILYRDQLIPHATLALDTAQGAWDANRGTLNDLLEARRMVVDGRLMLARAVAEQYRNMADLVLSCGLGDLEALQTYGLPLETNPAQQPKP